MTALPSLNSHRPPTRNEASPKSTFCSDRSRGVVVVLCFLLLTLWKLTRISAGITTPLGPVQSLRSATNESTGFRGSADPLQMPGKTIHKPSKKECQKDIIRSILQSDPYRLAGDKSLYLTCSTQNVTKVRQNATANFERAVSFVLQHKLAFLIKETLQIHKNAIMDVDSQKVPGIILECGVAKGGSSIVFAAVKSPDRCMHLHDTFQGLPPPSDKDGQDVHQRYSFIKNGLESKDYYGYMSGLMEYDQKMMKMSGFYDSSIHYHKGLFNETVFPIGPVAYAHLDGDWYVSVFGMLERITPWLSVGGWIILDDVTHSSGARAAFEDFFEVNFANLESGEGKIEIEKFGATFELSFQIRVHIQKTAVRDC